MKTILQVLANEMHNNTERLLNEILHTIEESNITRKLKDASGRIARNIRRTITRGNKK